MTVSTRIKNAVTSLTLVAAATPAPATYVGDILDIELMLVENGFTYYTLSDVGAPCYKLVMQVGHYQRTITVQPLAKGENQVLIACGFETEYVELFPYRSNVEVVEDVILSYIEDLQMNATKHQPYSDEMLRTAYSPKQGIKS